MRVGRCDTALAFLPANNRRDVCSRERSYRALTWTLRDREIDSANEVRLFYEVFRLGSVLPANTWITVRREKNVWRVVGFECWY